ncbi:MAG: DUF1189 family protein [Planctomycetota bacterium]|jgi:hypothetical protein
MEDHRKKMKKYSIFHIPVLSFFSKELYRDVGLNWKGVNFLYLLLLVVICMLPIMIKVYIKFGNFADNEAPAIIEQVPEITIKNGKVSINEPQPYYIKDPKSGDVLAIIDTTGQITSLGDTDALCLLTDNMLITKESEFKSKAYDLSNVKAFVVDSERVTGWLNFMRKFVVVFVFPFTLLCYYSFRIIQALIYAAIGLLFASWCKVTLTYATLLRLAVVAMTPCLLVKAIFLIAGIRLHCLTSLIFLIVTLAYLFFAVKANSEIILSSEEAKEPEEMII